MVMLAAGKVTWKPGFAGTAAFGEASLGEPVDGMTVMTPTTAAARTPTVTVAATLWAVSADCVTLASLDRTESSASGPLPASTCSSPSRGRGLIGIPEPTPSTWPAVNHELNGRSRSQAVAQEQVVTMAPRAQESRPDPSLRQQLDPFHHAQPPLAGAPGDHRRHGQEDLVQEAVL